MWIWLRGAPSRSEYAETDVSEPRISTATQASSRKCDRDGTTRHEAACDHPSIRRLTREHIACHQTNTRRAGTCDKQQSAARHEWLRIAPQCLPWPNSSFANKPNATMIKLPPAYVASDGSRPKRNQSATATKKTLNLKEVSTQGRKWRARNDSH